VERLTAFFIREHNATLPHAAFAGQTPDERYFGTGAHVPAELAAAKAKARGARLAANRAARCGTCPRSAPVTAPADDSLAP
jgi:putative transposase